jgi:hypothetical protein
MAYKIYVRTDAQTVERQFVFNNKTVASNFWRGVKMLRRVPDHWNENVVFGSFFKQDGNSLLAIDRV